MTQDESPLEQGMNMGDDQTNATDVGDYVDEGSTCVPRSNIS